MNEVQLTKKQKVILTPEYLLLLQEFINDSYAGRRTKKNGMKIRSSTIGNYLMLNKHLTQFTIETGFELKIYLISSNNLEERRKAKHYSNQLYQEFIRFLYQKRNSYDNYVGLLVKTWRSFYNYLEKERGIFVGSYHRSFFVPHENIPIITISETQLQYIINDPLFNKKVNHAQLTLVRDIFIFGCIVALRISDLLNLTERNIVKQNGTTYLRVKSLKTNTSTSIKLPSILLDIIEKYAFKNGKIFPEITSATFNIKLKALGLFLPENMVVIKTRERQGQPVTIYKDPLKKTHFTLADHLTAHTMRRTAITNMLCLGMPENIVRKISGHTAHSKEFYRYVELSQSYMDSETDKMFEKLLSTQKRRKKKRNYPNQEV